MNAVATFAQWMNKLDAERNRAGDPLVAAWLVTHEATLRTLDECLQNAQDEDPEAVQRLVKATRLCQRTLDDLARRRLRAA